MKGIKEKRRIISSNEFKKYYGDLIEE